MVTCRISQDRCTRVLGQADQGVNIENEAYPAIAEHGTTSDDVLLLKGMAEAFDDDFLFADEFIYQQGT